mmetsp:Transcript_34162/g.25232  ORF Transcript_34162/g.25232 Transcript_34162/m.25232 type:complete len:124 (+) Transcript_34162:1540-1911(+)
MAMTGEITTLGEVISIGGVREKLTACKNHNISRVILPISNRRNVSKLPQEFTSGFTIFYVKNIEQVYKLCFETELDSVREGSESWRALRDLDIEIDQFEEDNQVQAITQQESILKRNSLEELI